MTFLAPLVLAGLAALAVPILLHLLRRGESRVHPFPAFRYLRRTTREHARTIRLRQLLLLALRTAVLTLLVLAGARLVLPVGGRDHPPAGIVLVVDNGLASGGVVDDRRILDAVVAAGLEALERVGSADRIWIVPAGEPWRPAFPRDRTDAADLLRGLEPTHVTPDLDAALARAQALLRTGGPGLGQVILLSNLNVPLPRSEEGRGSPEHPVLVVSPEILFPPNRGVAEAIVGDGLAPRTGDGVELRISVGGTSSRDVPFNLRIDDELAASGRTGPAGAGTATLPAFGPGWVTGRVELEPDHLRADDVRHVAFRVEAPPRVGVAGRPSPYLTDALDVLEEGGRIVRTSARDADVLIVAQGAPPVDTAPGGQRLVVLAPDSPELLAGVNRVLAELRPGMRLERPTDPSPAREIDSRHSTVQLPGDPRVREAYRILHDEDPPRSLVALSDGTPWLVHLEGPDLDVLLLTSPLTPEAGDLPASAAMIPLVDFLVSPRSDAFGPGEITAGDPLPLPPGSHEVRLPGGTLRPVDGMSVFAETGRSGIYDVLDGDGEFLARIPVNPVPVEAEDRLDPREAATRLGPDVRGAGSGEAWAGEILAHRRGREVWRSLAALALLLLLVEGWYAGAGGVLPRSSSPHPGRRTRDSAAPRPSEAQGTNFRS